MALKRNMKLQEMLNFLDNELLPQARLEIQNWIKPKKRQGGYFVVVRQILCMVDFLGAIASGYPLSERKKDPKGTHIANTDKAICFILKFFGPKETYKEDVVRKLYSMYRHGLVHLYQPKILKLSSRVKLMWFFYKGKRQRKRISVDSPIGKITFKNVDHLEIVASDGLRGRRYLAVSINCLYDDFEAAVIKYRNRLQNTKSMQRKWRTTVNAICKPR